MWSVTLRGKGSLFLPPLGRWPPWPFCLRTSWWKRMCCVNMSWCLRLRPRPPGLDRSFLVKLDEPSVSERRYFRAQRRFEAKYFVKLGRWWGPWGLPKIPFGIIKPIRRCCHECSAAGRPSAVGFHRTPFGLWAQRPVNVFLTDVIIPCLCYRLSFVKESNRHHFDYTIVNMFHVKLHVLGLSLLWFHWAVFIVWPRWCKTAIRGVLMMSEVSEGRDTAHGTAWESNY